METGADHLDPQLTVLATRKAAQEAYTKSQTETAITKAKNARERIEVEFLLGETVRDVI